MNYNDELYHLLRYFRALQPESTFYQPLRFILDNLASLAAMSIYDMAEKCFVSTATISRLCKELGFKNYQDFKIRVFTCYHYTAAAAAAGTPVQIYSVPRVDTGNAKTAKALNYLDFCQEALALAQKFVHSEDFENHLNLLRSSQTVVIYTPRDRDMLPLVRVLLLDGKMVRQYTGDIQKIKALCNAELTDLAHTCSIAFPYMREEYDELLPLIQSQRKQGATSILICPDTFNVDYSLHEQVLCFPEVQGERDELIYSYYINCITIAY